MGKPFIFSFLQRLEAKTLKEPGRRWKWGGGEVGLRYDSGIGQKAGNRSGLLEE
jgi:hypothetical protein